jgi:hypothetical protein
MVGGAAVLALLSLSSGTVAHLKADDVNDHPPAVSLTGPLWSWDVVPNYFHCANVSGEWNDEALAIMATKPFVVFEKNHKLFEAPANDQAEAKIIESCRRVKALNSTVQCLMYVESDWARSYYSLGHWVAANANTAALKRPDGTYVNTSGTEQGGPNQTVDTFYYSYDFSNVELQQHWTSRVTDAVATGHVDGAFVDGDRNGWDNNNAGKANLTQAQLAAFQAGMNASYYQMALNLSHIQGRATTIITNYPTKESMAFSTGGMTERGLALKDYEHWSEMKCGLAQETCVLDWHTDHGTGAKFVEQLATFLLGVYKGAFFGVGSGWSGDGDGACDAWLHPDGITKGGEIPKEYTNALGEPLGPFVTKNNSQFGLAMTRKFASGTHVYVGHNPAVECAVDEKSGKPKCAVGHCIFWSNGDVSADNATLCEQV